MADETQNETMMQKKARLAQGDLAPAAIEILKECMKQLPLVADSEFQTVVNAIRMDTQSDIIIEFIKRLEEIREQGIIRPD